MFNVNDYGNEVGTPKIRHALKHWKSFVSTFAKALVSVIFLIKLLSKKNDPKMRSEAVLEKIRRKLSEVASYAEDIPGVVIVHDVHEFTLLYMSPMGLRLLGKRWDELAGLTGTQYHERFFHPEFAQHTAPKVLQLIQSNSPETISFFQQVRTAPGGEWDWYMSMIRILLRDDDGNPLLTITVAMKIDPAHYLTAKMSRLIDENQFLRKNFERFSLLTNREKEVLRLLAVGQTTNAVATQLHISVTTAETHRKKIKQKLAAKSNFDLTSYAQAFDMI